MANVPQVFSVGLGLSQESSAPTAFNGLTYYDSVRNSFRHYINGSWVDVSSQSAITTDANLDSSNFTAAVVSSSFIRISGQSTARSIFGLTASTAGKRVILSNASSFTLTIANQSGSEGTAANKIITDTGADVSLVAGATATLVYDSTSSRWRLLTAGIGAIVNGGNAFGATMSIGTTDAQSLILKTNNTTALTIDSAQQITVATQLTTPNVYLSGSTPIIAPNTSDGSDNAVLQIWGGGAGDVSRGAGINLFGNEQAATGKLRLYAGNVSGGDIEFYTGNAVNALTLSRTSQAATFTGAVTAPSLSLNGTSVPAASASIYQPATNVLGFGLGATAIWRMELDYFLAERTAAFDPIIGVNTGSNTGALTFSSHKGGTSSSGAFIKVWGNSSSGTGILDLNAGNVAGGQIQLVCNGSNAIIWNGSTGGFFPNTDDAFKIGKSGNRWSEVWAANGTIQTSDKRLKKNIEKIEKGLSVIEKLNPVTYNWTEKAERGFTFKGQLNSGFIAQEILEDLPGIPLGVNYDPESDNYGFAPQQIIPYLVASIKELKAEIDRPIIADLVESIKELKAEIDSLKASSWNK